MLIEDLDAMYEETYKKNDTIQTLLLEVRDHNEILTFLYDTEIQRPNLTLNSMIDAYESLLLKLRELHANIMSSLEEFGEEQTLAAAISENDSLTEKTSTLMLWKLRRIFMVYDKEPVLPYIEGSLHNLELIPEETPEEPTPDGTDSEDQYEPNTEDTNNEDQEEPILPPNGGGFPNSGNKNPA